MKWNDDSFLAPYKSITDCLVTPRSNQSKHPPSVSQIGPRLNFEFFKEEHHTVQFGQLFYPELAVLAEDSTFISKLHKDYTSLCAMASIHSEKLIQPMEDRELVSVVLACVKKFTCEIKHCRKELLNRLYILISYKEWQKLRFVSVESVWPCKRAVMKRKHSYQMQNLTLFLQIPLLVLRSQVGMNLPALENSTWMLKNSSPMLRK